MHDNIFSKIDLVASLMKKHFSSKSLISIRILKIINSLLSLYIENLKIKDELNKAIAIGANGENEFYEKELTKNTKQNFKIENNLDNLIEEIMAKNNNDDKINKMLNEFDHSMQILKKLT